MHTPGPYFPDLSGENTICTADGFIVATVNPYASSFDDGKHLANQHLLSAAPELLAALEAAMELGAYRGDRMPIKAVKPIFDAMKAAIAKAKGETM